MDFLERKESESIEHAVVDGISVTAGFVGSGFLGTELEKRVKVVTKASPITDKLIAGGVNNLSKVAAYYLLDMLGSGHEIDVAKLGITGNIITDILVRVTSDGVNDGKIFGRNILSEGKNTNVQSSDAQRLIQENSSLRTELNKALQRIATQPRVQTGTGQAPVVYVQPVRQVPNPLQVPAQQNQARINAQQNPQQVVNVAPVIVAQEPPIIQERDRKFGFMETEEEKTRRRFGSMPTYDAPMPVKNRERKYGFASPKEELATMFNML